MIRTWKDDCKQNETVHSASINVTQIFLPLLPHIILLLKHGMDATPFKTRMASALLSKMYVLCLGYQMCVLVVYV